MLSPNLIKSILLVGLIASLLILGLGIALRSGTVNLSTGQGMRRLAENFYQTCLLVMVVMVGLAVIQQLVGLRMGMFW
jgi:hypothetical protein